jgi:hypothetical protein
MCFACSAFDLWLEIDLHDLTKELHHGKNLQSYGNTFDFICAYWVRVAAKQWLCDASTN